jgi:acetolactate synthase-1/2/3 large subunit
MATAVKHGINTVTVVFNDDAFGNVLRMQKQRYGGRVIASELHNPDFVAFAESFGARGIRVQTPVLLQDAMSESLESELPVLIEVQVGEMPAPWPRMSAPTTRKEQR